MTRVKKWLGNGGKKDIVYYSTLLGVLITLAKFIFVSGQTQNEYETLKVTVKNIHSDCIPAIQKDIEEIKSDSKETKNDIAWIKSCLRGELR
jgi:peptidoglycan hydrolase CwlO-like protein